MQVGKISVSVSERLTIYLPHSPFSVLCLPPSVFYILSFYFFLFYLCGLSVLRGVKNCLCVLAAIW